MSSNLQEQQSFVEGSFDIKSNKTTNYISGNSKMNVIQHNLDSKIQELKNNKFFKNKNNISNEDIFYNSNIPIQPAPKLFCQTLLDDMPQSPLRNPISTLPQPDLNRISHLFQGNQKDFSTKEIPDGFLQHQPSILHYQTKCNQNSKIIDNRINPTKIKINICSEENKIQQSKHNTNVKGQEKNKNEIEDFYKEKYIRTKEKYKEAKQIISSLQSKLLQISSQNNEVHQNTKKTSNNEIIKNHKAVQTQEIASNNEIIQNQDINKNKVSIQQMRSNNLIEQVTKIKKKYTILKEELNKSKAIIDKQNKQISQLQSKISELQINKTTKTTNNNSKYIEVGNEKANNENFLILKKGHLHFKGKIKSRSKSLSKHFSPSTKKFELTPHPIRQYKYLCNMLNVKSDEFDQQWDKVFRKIADLLNSNTALKQINSKKIDLLNKQNDDLTKKVNILSLSSRFGNLISGFSSNMYKEIEDLHSTITRKTHSHFREIILTVIFTNRILNMIKYNSFTNEKSLTIFAENPFYSPQVLIGEIRSNFTTLSQDLVYSQSMIKRKNSKI